MINIAGWSIAGNFSNRSEEWVLAHVAPGCFEAVDRQSGGSELQLSLEIREIYRKRVF
jgi:hypothetical protein